MLVVIRGADGAKCAQFLVDQGAEDLETAPTPKDRLVCLVSMSERQLLLLEDLFKITAVDPDGKKFDRVSRIKATGENLGMDLILDVNIEIYPLALGERLNIALAKTLNLDGTASDEGSYRPDAAGPSLADSYDYVMYGRLFKFENTSNANRMYGEIYIYTDVYAL